MLQNLLAFVKNAFGRKKDEDPVPVLKSCMEDICTQLVKHLSGKHYKWDANEGVKSFECLILSKFLMDHALISTFHTKIDDSRVEFYLKMHDSIFDSILHRTFPANNSSDIIKNRLVSYSTILSNNPHPRCWQLIAGTCTGIDYYAQEDLDTLVSSSSVLPLLLAFAQDSLKIVVKQ